MLRNLYYPIECRLGCDNVTFRRFLYENKDIISNEFTFTDFYKMLSTQGRRNK